MAGELLVLDSFDYYADTGTTTYGVTGSWPGPAAANFTLVSGVFGGQAVSIAANTAGVHALPTAQTKFSIGARVQTTASAAVLGLLGAMIGATAQITLCCSNGFLQARRGNSGGAVLGTDTTVPLVSLAWYFLEIEIELSATVGIFRAYIDGVRVLNLTGINTLASGTTVDGVAIYGTSGKACAYDDIYCRNGSTCYGPAKVECLRPSSDASVTWTPNSGATNFSRVDETLADGDTSYVSSATLNQVDLYGIGALSSTPATIFAVQQRVLARKDDAGTRTLSNTLKSGATTTQSSNYNLSASYVWSTTTYDTDPNTLATWTAANVNSLNVGMKMVA